MGGINGIYCGKECKDLNYRIKKMNNALLHRGPDGSGYFIYNNKIALGQRRLLVIDVNSGATQPLTSKSGRWSIVFSGQIYNIQELQQKLDRELTNTSIVEIILAFIEMYGIEELLLHSNGMFAFALFDKANNKMYIARDRLGIKPLYFSLIGDKFIFSSEIKGILNSGFVEAIFNKEAIDEYLGYRYVREPYTFFKNIYQVEAGTFVIIDDQFKVCTKKYWELPDEFNMDSCFDEEKIADEFEKLLIQAVNLRLRSDMPLGTYLSGGVDSSLITAITTNALGKKINTYTIGFPELNEFSYANLVANRYNTMHHNIQIDFRTYFEGLDEVISYKDAPLGVPNEIPLALLSKVLKKRITVVLSGEGADELLGGYGRIFRSPFDYKYTNCEQIDFYSYFINKYEYVSRNFRDKFLLTNKEMRDVFDQRIRKDFEGRINEENVFRFFLKYHVKSLLQRIDVTTMSAGVEARVPFLDHRLIEYSYKSIPHDLKLKWKTNKLKEDAKGFTSDIYSETNDIPKYLIKKIGYKYLPREIIERKKMGFPVPLNKWLPYMIENLAHHLKDAYWLKNKSLENLISECKKSNISGQIIWMLLNIEIFRKKYFLKDWRY